jgi:hypothetical protein
MNSVLIPLTTIQQAFSLIFLKLSTSDSKFVCETFNEIFLTNYNENILNLTVDKYLRFFKLNINESKKLLASLQAKVKSKSKLLSPVKMNFKK